MLMLAGQVGTHSQHISKTVASLFLLLNFILKHNSSPTSTRSAFGFYTKGLSNLCLLSAASRALHRCGLLQQMSNVAWPVCVSVCLLVTQVSPASTTEPIEMRFGGLTHVGP